LDLKLIPLAAILGLCLGSFLNVCIHRIPKGISIIYPSSSCPWCGSKIRALDNIPLLSYLILKGRCRNCGKHISIVYPIVEVLTSFVTVLVYIRFGLKFDAVLYLIFCYDLIVISFIDLRHKVIPDVLSVGGIGAGLLASLFLVRISFFDSILGILFGGAFLYLIAFTYFKLKKIEGMGGGDIKLIAMIGAWLGYKSLPFVLLTGSLIGVIVGMIAILILKKGRYYEIPFGPFLSLGAYLYLFLDQRYIYLFIP
jgi:leader peptidase (prepilin peptidase)/N-methyltransferase